MKGKITIIGDIGSGDDFAGIELVDVISQVKSQPEATSFDVYINSGGGVVETGEDIYNYLKSLKVPITTIGTGIVASIATVVFMAGNTRRLMPNTEFMIHLPMGSVSYLTADQIAEYGKEVKSIESRMVKFYSGVTSLEEEAILPLLKNETWLTPEQLKNFGFTNSEPLLTVAKAKININSKTRQMSKKAESMLEKILALVVKKQTLETSLILFNADEGEVDFFELEADASPSVGDKATVDGEVAEGSFVMADGSTFVFVAGELTEIVTGEEDELTLEEALAALDIANAEIVDLTETSATLTATNTTLTEEVATLTKEGAANKAVVAKIVAMRSKIVKTTNSKKGGQTGKPKDKSRFATAMAEQKA
jgi:ATP-dependent Clp protease protease subunit